ncbi:hypothetical protein [Anabaena sp. CCY 0017]|uniref:hypothetical protein n=1 Tax=Anabaena sp. CCY 0017 TaxID=3103866 RepID=UPI0039C6A24C
MRIALILACHSTAPVFLDCAIASAISKAEILGHLSASCLYSSSRCYEVQILMIKLLWCGHLARYVYLIAEGSAV